MQLGRSTTRNRIEVALKDQIPEIREVLDVTAQAADVPPGPNAPGPN